MAYIANPKKPISDDEYLSLMRAKGINVNAVHDLSGKKSFDSTDSYMQEMVRDHYLTPLGEPLKCPACDCLSLRYEPRGENELEVLCNDCNLVVGHSVNGSFVL